MSSTGAPSPPNCLILDGNTPCGPDVAGYPVLGQFFATVSDFSNAINNYIGNLDSVANSFVNGSGCDRALTRPAVNGLRFQASVWCASAINDAISSNCTFARELPPRGPLLCDTQCSTSVASLSAVLSNSTICPMNVNQDALMNRNATVGTIRSYCAIARANQPSNGNNLCSNGVPMENRFCGWRDQNLANQMCTSMTSDPCCARLLNMTAVNNAPNNGSTSNLQSGGGSGTPVWIPIVVSILVFLALVVAGVFGYQYWKKRQRRSAADAELEATKDMNPKGKSPAFNAYSQQSLPTNSVAPVNVPNDPTRHLSVMPPANLSMQPTISQHSQMSQFSQKSTKVTLPTIEEDNRMSVLPVPGLVNNTQVLGAGIPVESEGIPKGAKAMLVIHPYQATLEDELTLEVGTEIYLIQDFDDGWGLALDPNTGRQGAVPLVCCIDSDEVAKKEAEWQTTHRQDMTPPASADSDRVVDLPTASPFDPLKDFKRLSFGTNTSYDRVNAIRSSFANKQDIQISERRSSSMFSPRFSTGQTLSLSMVSSPLASDSKFSDISAPPPPTTVSATRAVSSVTNPSVGLPQQPPPKAPLPTTPESVEESEFFSENESEDEDDNMPLGASQFKMSQRQYVSETKTQTNESHRLQVPINISPVTFSPLMGDDDFDPR